MRISHALAPPLVLLLLVALLPSPSWAAAEGGAPLRVLTLHSLDPSFPWQTEVERGLAAGFAPQGRRIEHYAENLDAGRFPGEAQALVTERFLADRYAGKAPDVVIAEGGAATRFVMARPALFPQARRVLVNYTHDPGPGMAAIMLRSDFRAAIAEMLAVSRARRVAVVGDVNDVTGRALLNEFKPHMAALGGAVPVEYLTNLPQAELEARLAALPSDAAVFYLLMFSDGAGKPTTPYKAAERLAAVSAAPIFSHWTSLLGSGIAGGYLISGERVGSAAARVALALAEGREVSVEEASRAAYGAYYDWRQLRRHGLDESHLPAGTQILYRQPSFFDEYRWPIIVVLSLTALLAVAVALLLRLDVSRRRALAELDRERSLLELRVTERTAALSEASSALESSNQELQQFAYAVSHDLQEPLRTITSYLQLLERRLGSSLEDDARQFLNFAVDGGQRMHTMIKDLLEYSRLGSEAASTAPLDATAALAEALDNLHGLMKQSGAKVTAGPLPQVLASAPQIVRLFQNLVGNAVKYASPDRQPKVDITAEWDGAMWVFAVADNGIGIAPEFAERVFGLFQRLHGRGQYSGNGVGLALCKRIVERHGGRIWVEGREEEGCTFRFTLPAVSEAVKPAQVRELTA